MGTNETEPARASQDDPWLQFRALFNQTFGYLAILRPDGTVIDVNDPPLKRAGLTREECVGTKFWDCGWWVPSPVSRRKTQRAIRRAASGTPVRDECAYYTTAGEELIVDRSLTPIRDDAGRVVMVLAEGRDVTEVRAIERERDEVLAALARAEERARVAMDLHDGVLAELSGSTMALAAAARRAGLGTETGAQMDWAANVVRRASITLRGFTERLRSSKREGELGSAVARLRELAAELRSTWCVDVQVRAGPRWDDQLGPLVVDHLLHIAREAVANAARHGGARSVVVELRRERGRNVVSVRDSGTGIDPTRAASGMGLANMRRRARALGGRLTIASAPGEGTRVRLSFPTDSVGAPANDAPDLTAPPPTLL